MSKQLKVTIKSITVNNNGESGINGKGEVYWRFDIDSVTLVERAEKFAQKVSDGEVISINESRVVNKVGNDLLDIFGTIGERDWPSKDETVSFTHQYTNVNGWGVGSYSINRKYGKLDVTTRYEIENA